MIALIQRVTEASVTVDSQMISKIDHGLLLLLGIEKTDDGCVVVDSDLKFSDEEVKSLIKEHPERFSPNVVLRPLYQETILPNLAYFGGPSELIYWLQLKPVFDHFKTAFPILMPRNFALIVAPHQKRKWDKTGIEFKDIFLNDHSLENVWLEKHVAGDLSYSAEKEIIEKVSNRWKEYGF